MNIRINCWIDHSSFTELLLYPVKNQVAVVSWHSFWVLLFVSLISVSLSPRIPHTQYHWSCESWNEREGFLSLFAHLLIRLCISLLKTVGCLFFFCDNKRLSLVSYFIDVEKQTQNMSFWRHSSIFLLRSENVTAFPKTLVLWKGHFENWLLEIIPSLCDFCCWRRWSNSIKFTLKKASTHFSNLI